jgi:hypothetical protein
LKDYKNEPSNSLKHEKLSDLTILTMIRSKPYIQWEGIEENPPVEYTEINSYAERRKA